MEWLNGKKTYLVAIAIGIVAGLQAAGILDDAAVEKAYGLLGALGLVTLRAGVAKAAPVILAVLGLGWFVTGCGGQLTVAECQSRVEQAKVAKLGCTYFPEETDRLKCEHSADIAVAAAMLGCEWADRPPAEEPV